MSNPAYSVPNHTPGYFAKVGSHFKFAINTPAALTGDAVNGLPPYHGRKTFLVDKYPACPSSWLRSEGKVASLFVPVNAGRGLWLDFNGCHESAYNVAVVVSIQGVNAVTGLPCNDAQLEQYLEKCPKHNTPFGPERLCRECGFKWPRQNYLSSIGTYGKFWIDGFRSPDGTVRQYVLTEETLRSVANAILGQSRVFSIGLSFFLSKVPKPIVHVERRGLEFFGGEFFGGALMDQVPISKMWVDSTSHGVDLTSYGTSTAALYDGAINLSAGAEDGDHLPDNVMMSRGLTGKMSKQHGGVSGASVKCSNSRANVLYACNISDVKQVSVKNMEIAAGAKIAQEIVDDSNDLSFWQEKPESIVVINYCTEDEANKIIESGEVDLSGHREGFLQNVPVGNT